MPVGLAFEYLCLWVKDRLISGDNGFTSLRLLQDLPSTDTNKACSNQSNHHLVPNNKAHFQADIPYTRKIDLVRINHIHRAGRILNLVS